MIIFLLTLFVISIILLIPTILLQSNGANNGMMSSNITAGAFGARSNEILVKFTSYCIATFILCALLLSIHYIRLSSVSYEAPDTQAPVTETIEDIPFDEEGSLPLAE